MYFINVSLIIIGLSLGAHAAPISIQASEGAQPEERQLILANTQGLTLYTFTPDVAGESTCYDACEKAWPPVIIKPEEAITLGGALSTSVRRDGLLQLRVDNKPVYLYVGDEKPGDIFGQGLGNVWFIINVLTK